MGAMRWMGVALTVAALVTVPGATVEAVENLEDFYAVYLAEKADLCAGKCCFLDSRSQALRQYAEDSLAKAAFLKNHKGRLVDKLMEANCGKKPYKIDYLIIEEFKDFRQGAGGKSTI